MLRSIAAECECSCSHSRSALRCVSKHEDAHIGSSSSFETRARPFVLCGFSSACALLRMRTASRSVQLTISNSPSRSRGAFSAPGVCNFASLTPNRGVGGAPRNVRVLGGTPIRRAHNAARQALARRLASHDAGRSPLGAPPWRFWAPGAALPSPSAPAVLQRRAVAFRIRAASSSHPGRSAWRAGSLPPGANGYEPPPQDATPRSAFRIVSRTRPQ